MKVYVVLDIMNSVVGLYTCMTDAHLHWKRLSGATIYQGLLNSEHVNRVETELSHWAPPRLVRQNAVRDDFEVDGV
eukprot:SAG11_NODE_21_length_25065_cov_3.589081_20_plen_76_part_00